TKRLLIDGVEQTFDPAQELRRLKSLCQGLNVDLEPIVERAEREIYDGASRAELDRALAMAARVLIETDPIYNQVLVRMDLDVYYAQVL
ncbi:hypothetical protein ABTL13_19545, partial [Acinetobacter baumannii]